MNIHADIYADTALSTEDAEFSQAWKNGMLLKDLAELLGCSIPTVSNRARRLGLPRRRAGPKSGATPKSTAKVKAGRRFEGIKPAPERVTSIPDSHPAIVEQRSMFPTRRTEARHTPRLLVEGKNNRKIGDRVQKGAWAGMPIFTLTLEERATCPRHCMMYNRCYGNAMHHPRRHAHGPEFEKRLVAELAIKAIEHPDGFVVRLHILGDFYSAEYVQLWGNALSDHPNLYVFGYTAVDDALGDEDEVKTARAIKALKFWAPDRFRIRWSRRYSVPDGATVITHTPERKTVTEGVVCPAETEDTACCATCGFCWSMATKSKTVVFIQHGLQKGPRA